MAQDSSLSFQARGLLLYVLSKPRNWNGKSSDLQREGNLKEKALKTILDELIEKRYITRVQFRVKGKFNCRLEVFEEPGLNEPVDNSTQELNHPPLKADGTDPPSRPPREGGRSLISTGARAGSSIPTKNKKSASAQVVKEVKAPVVPPLELPFPGIVINHEWGRYEAYRKESGRRLTNLTREALFNQFTEWGEEKSIRALRRAVKDSWQGMYDPDQKNSGYSQPLPKEEMKTVRERLIEQGVKVRD